MKSVPALAVMAMMLLSNSFAHAQQARALMLEAGADGVHHIKELQTILTSENDTVSVLTVLPHESRPDGYAEIQLQEGDEILMVNRQRVKSVAEFETSYQELKVGAEIKLGLRRDDQFRIISFKKADPEILPDSGLMIQTVTTEDSSRPWMGTGLLLTQSDSVVTVRQILYDAEILEGEILEEGDAFLSLNGRKIRNLEHFFEMYSRLNTGAKVTVTFRRDEQKKEFWFRKPDVSGRVRIER